MCNADKTSTIKIYTCSVKKKLKNYFTQFKELKCIYTLQHELTYMADQNQGQKNMHTYVSVWLWLFLCMQDIFDVSYGLAHL